MRLCLRVRLRWRWTMTLANWWRELNGKGLRPGLYKYDGLGVLQGHRFNLRIDSESKGRCSLTPRA